jgi:hypothetical protein
VAVVLEHRSARIKWRVYAPAKTLQRNLQRFLQYALRDLKKPIGVAQWQTKLVESLPRNLKGSLPTVAEIEAELDNARPK